MLLSGSRLAPFLFLLAVGVQSFTTSDVCRRERIQQSSTIYVTRQRAVKAETTLMDEFRIAGGEIVDPYKVLKVSRDANRQTIKKAYRDLSRKYHPDGVRYRTLLPGNCNNLDEVRDHWERVKFSYEILKDKKTRQRYDRHSSLSDPGAALGRAAISGIGWGVVGISKGIFNAGKFAVSKLTDDDEKKP